jgi:hypothetical protein
MPLFKQVLETSLSDLGGVRTASAAVSGSGVYGRMRYDFLHASGATQNTALCHLIGLHVGLVIEMMREIW